MAENEPLVIYEVRDDVAYATLNSPPLNIMTAAMMREVAAVAERAAGDATLKALVVRAKGKAFSAGADVGEHAPDKAGEMIGTFSAMFRQLFALDIPVVMAVNGAALGGGFELVMAGDQVIASKNAKFGQPEIRLGFFAPLGVAYLPELVGHRRAMELTCGGRVFDAHTMERWGFVSQVVEPEALDEAVEAFLADLRAASPLVLRLNVRTLKRTRGMGAEKGRVEAERVFLEELMKTEEVPEGIAAFYEKRPPVWKNR
ncbi:MAG: enoyl-CoA hydratase/isomerase family protein [Polyangia bacterium]|jgi:cyclohexa-1,5-dienecarbonyl-CoA hydratase|nr:enoyl-CoA hydratase/isomerase family protein [Polyangia bacterium]